MNRLTFTLIFIVAAAAGAPLYGQHNTLLSQYYQNPSIVNPAFTGINSFTSATAGFRQQWSGLPDAPQTYLVTLDAILVKPKFENIKSNALRISDPSLYTESTGSFNRLAATKHGVGLQVMNDTYGPFSQLSAYASYGFHFPITRKLKFTIGVSGGVEHASIDHSKVKVRNEDTDQSYQDFLASSERNLDFDVNLGGLLYHNNFYIGYSVFNLMRNELVSNTDLELEKQNLVHTFMAGYKFPLGLDYQLLPGILVQTAGQLPPRADFSLKMRYRKDFLAGLTYRDSKEIVLITGFYLNDTFNFGYSYDFSIAGLNDQLKGSHEIVLGVAISKSSSAAPYAW